MYVFLFNTFHTTDDIFQKVSKIFFINELKFLYLQIDAVFFLIESYVWFKQSSVLIEIENISIWKEQKVDEYAHFVSVQNTKIFLNTNILHQFLYLTLYYTK